MVVLGSDEVGVFESIVAVAPLDIISSMFLITDFEEDETCLATEFALFS